MVRINIYTGSLQKDTNGYQNVVTKNAGNPFDCTIMFTKPYRRFREVSLKNVQIPIGFYNVRSPLNTVTINTVTYTVPVGNYTLATLITALNTAVGAGVGVFAQTTAPVDTRLKFTPVSGATFSVSTSVTTLGGLLGFTDGQVTTGTTVLTATNSFLFPFDIYVNIYVKDIGTSSPEVSQSTFKIPLNVTTGNILWKENSENSQVIQVTDCGNRVDRLSIQVLDQFGNILNNNGIDWSFTLEIDCDP
jgi:hypothetical protein